MRKGIAILLASGGLAAAGCSVPKEAGFPDVRAAVEARIGLKATWNQGSAADAEVSKAIRGLLRRPLSASDAVQIALLNNRNLQATYEELMVSQADVVEAGLLRNPTFSAAVQFPSTTVGPIVHAGVEQDFLSLLLLPARKRLAQSLFEVTKLRVAHEVISVAFDVRVAYFKLQTAQQVAAMRKEILDTADASLELATRQHEAQSISDLDLVNERDMFDRIRIEQAKSEVLVLVLREELNRKMGVWGSDVAWSTLASLPPIPDGDPPLASLESTAIKQRLDVAAAVKEVEAQYRALGMTKDWRFLGAASLGLDYEREPDGHFIGPTAALELPIFDQKQADVARREARARQAEARLHALAVEVRSEVREARARVLFSRRLAEYYKTVVIPRRERRVALTQQQYDAMLMGVFQLIQAKQDEIDAYREYIEATGDYWMARAELDRALGGQLAADLPAEAAKPAPAPGAEPGPSTAPGHEHHHH